MQAVIDFGEDEGIADDVAMGVMPLAQQVRPPTSFRCPLGT